jgi:serine/threonine-protein kinase RsbT
VLLEARSFATDLGFDAPAVAKVSTVVSELGRNILKYAGQGDVLLKELPGPPRGIEVVVSDRGPGIEDVEVALQDHFSSGGTLGLGLPGVRRLADEFDIQSAPGKGTRVTFRKWLR